MSSEVEQRQYCVLLRGWNLNMPQRFNFKATNNQAEYEALIAGLNIARELGAKDVWVKNDSQLVVGQVLGTFEVKEEKLKRYLVKAWELRDHFKSFKVGEYPENRTVEQINQLSQLPSRRRVQAVIHPWKCQTSQQFSSQMPNQVIHEIGWAQLIIDHLKSEKLPRDKKEAKKLKIRAERFTLVKKVLY